MITHLHQILAELTALTLIQAPAGQDPAVTSLCCDSRKAVIGSIFFCVKGANVDGHRFAPAAYTGGARAFIVEDAVHLPTDAHVYRVPDARLAMAQAAAAFYGHPEREMRLVGLTGTKGKTTTALLLQSVLNEAEIPTGYVGTNGVSFGTYRFPTVNSTPESLEIYRYLRMMLDNGVRTAVLEVSSQALWMHRIHGLAFEATLFTNLSVDHIGGVEHPDFDHYRDSKRRLFTEYPARTVVYNADDPSALGMIEGVTGATVSISTEGADGAHWRATHILPCRRGERMGTSFRVRYNGTRAVGELPRSCFLPLPGRFNVQNALCVLAIACDVFGVAPAAAADALSRAVVPGRFETVTHPRLPHVTFVIDYAHNGVSLASILNALRAYKPHRLICLFGSVGDRTLGRRTELAMAAAGRADLCILTSDNPGREDPMHILSMIDEAFPAGSCSRELIPDRHAAVARAVALAEPGDIILLAGKGHENYQLVGTEHLPYSEHEALLLGIARRFGDGDPILP